MISSLATLADRNFVIGFLLPVMLAAMAYAFVFQDIGPIGAIWTAIVDAEKFATLTLLLLAIWSVAVLLSVFNISFYRLLEGYTGPFATEKHRRAAVEARRSRQEQLGRLSGEAQKGGPGSKAWMDFFVARREFLSDYPTLADDCAQNEVELLVLPTRFGNVIRACETYPRKTYGIESIPSWLRLAAVIPADFQAIISGARAEVDCFVSVVFLSLSLAIFSAIFALDLIAPCVFASCNSFWHDQFDPILARRFCSFLMSIAVAWLAYDFAINRARAWGDIVRSAYDLYLPALAKQLGFELPDSLADRKLFWGAFNSMFLDGTVLDPEKMPKPAAAGSGDNQFSPIDLRQRITLLPPVRKTRLR